MRYAKLLAGAAVAAGLAALAVPQLSGGAPEPVADKDERFLDAEVPGVLGFENGDCFHDPAINAARGESLLATVECVGAENEVYTFSRLTDGPWEFARLRREARAGCGEAFDELWGADSGYRFYAVLPTRRTWEESKDRDAMCVVYSPAGSFTVDPLEVAG